MILDWLVKIGVVGVFVAVLAGVSWTGWRAADRVRRNHSEK